MQGLANPVFDSARVEKLIKGAKAEEAHFAFGLGATPDRNVLAVDKTKAGKALFEACRKEAGARKGAYGTVRLDGMTAVLVCEKDETTDLAKAMLAYFRANKIGLKVALAEAGATPEAEAEHEEHHGEAREDTTEGRDGDEGEAEGEEAEDDVPEGRIYDPEIIVPLIRKARKRARPFAFGTGPGVNLLAVHPKMEPIRLAKKLREDGAKKGVWGLVQLDGAVAVFTCEKQPFAGVKKGIRLWLKDRKLTLKFRLQGPDGEFADPEDAASEAVERQPGQDGPDYAGARRRLSDLVAGTIALLTDEQRGEMSARLKQADALAGQGEAREAMARIDALVREITSVPGHQRLLPLWNEVKEALDAEFAVLRQALRRIQHPAFQLLADKGFLAVTGGRHTRMMAALFDYQNSPTAGSAEALRKAIRGYRELLSPGSLLDNYDKNPLGVSVNFGRRLAKGLNRLEQALDKAS